MRPQRISPPARLLGDAATHISPTCGENAPDLPPTSTLTTYGQYLTFNPALPIGTTTFRCYNYFGRDVGYDIRPDVWPPEGKSGADEEVPACRCSRHNAGRMPAFLR